MITKEKLIKNKTFRKVLIVTFMIVVIFSFVFLINNLQEDKMDEEETQYAGPVRPTDDEEYFRKTGITRPLEVKENGTL